MARELVSTIKQNTKPIQERASKLGVVHHVAGRRRGVAGAGRPGAAAPDGDEARAGAERRSAREATDVLVRLTAYNVVRLLPETAERARADPSARG